MSLAPSLSPSTDTTVAPTLSPTLSLAPSVAGSPPRLTTEVIALIVIAGVVVVVCLAMMCYRKLRRKKPPSEAMEVEMVEARVEKDPSRTRGRSRTASAPPGMSSLTHEYEEYQVSVPPTRSLRSLSNEVRPTSLAVDNKQPPEGLVVPLQAASGLSVPAPPANRRSLIVPPPPHSAISPSTSVSKTMEIVGALRARGSTTTHRRANSHSLSSTSYPSDDSSLRGKIGRIVPPPLPDDPDPPPPAPIGRKMTDASVTSQFAPAIIIDPATPRASISQRDVILDVDLATSSDFSVSSQMSFPQILVSAPSEIPPSLQIVGPSQVLPDSQIKIPVSPPPESSDLADSLASTPLLQISEAKHEPSKVASEHNIISLDVSSSRDVVALPPPPQRPAPRKPIPSPETLKHSISKQLDDSPSQAPSPDPPPPPPLPVPQPPLLTAAIVRQFASSREPSPSSANMAPRGSDVVRSRVRAFEARNSTSERPPSNGPSPPPRTRSNTGQSPLKPSTQRTRTLSNNENPWIQRANKSGKTFYLNLNTGESVWENPMPQSSTP